MPQIKVRYYARLRELTGRDSETLQLDDSASVGDAVTRIMCSHPVLVPLRNSLLVARNDEFARPGDNLAEGDHLDLMPPVSGG